MNAERYPFLSDSDQDRLADFRTREPVKAEAIDSVMLAVATKELFFERTGNNDSIAYDERVSAMTLFYQVVCGLGYGQATLMARSVILPLRKTGKSKSEL